MFTPYRSIYQFASNTSDHDDGFTALHVQRNNFPVVLFDYRLVLTLASRQFQEPG